MTHDSWISVYVYYDPMWTMTYDCMCVCLSWLMPLCVSSLCVCLWLYVYHEYVSMCLCVYVSMCLCVSWLSVYVSMCLCMYVSMCLCVYVSMTLCVSWLSVYVSMCLCIYISMCLCVYVSMTLYVSWLSVYVSMCRVTTLCVYSDSMCIMTDALRPILTHLEISCVHLCVWHDSSTVCIVTHAYLIKIHSLHT